VPAVVNCTEDSDADELEPPAVVNCPEDSDAEVQPLAAITPTRSPLFPSQIPKNLLARESPACSLELPTEAPS
jgi:hypothetical protein